MIKKSTKTVYTTDDGVEHASWAAAKNHDEHERVLAYMRKANFFVGPLDGGEALDIFMEEWYTIYENINTIVSGDKLDVIRKSMTDLGEEMLNWDDDQCEVAKLSAYDQIAKLLGVGHETGK